MTKLLNKYPLITNQAGTPTIQKDKGELIFKGMLLNNYKNSTHFKDYMMCFIGELDFLFEQIQEVYFGRMLEYAVGNQLDVIGIELQQSRSIVLPDIWFGLSDNYNDPLGIDGLSTEAAPTVGGAFIDKNVRASVTPLDDTTYRKVLKMVSLLRNREALDINTSYYAIHTLLGRVPNSLKLHDKASDSSLAERHVRMDISSTDITDKEAILLSAMSKYYIPMGITFTINRS